jgi:hypothetical protein
MIVYLQSMAEARNLSPILENKLPSLVPLSLSIVAIAPVAMGT